MAKTVFESSRILPIFWPLFCFFFWLMVLIGSPTKSRAESVRPLLRGPGVAVEEFEAYATAEGLPTYAEYLEANRPKKANEEKLANLLERAQRLWVAGRLDDARSAFKDLSLMALEDDWREAQRESILYAMLRLAQSSASTLEATDWIEKAAQTFTDLDADTALFPPPLVKNYNEARSRARTLARTLRLQDVFKDARYVLVNGRKHSLKSARDVRIPPGLHRVTALSDARAPLTLKMNSSQLANYQSSAPSLSAGNCTAPEFFDVPGAESSAVYFGTRCVRSRETATALPAGKISETGPERLDVVPTPQATSSFGFSKSTWIGIGLTAVVVGAVIAIKSQSQTRVEPVDRQGF